MRTLGRLCVAAGLAAAGCTTVTAGADKRWPPLVVISGKVSVPATYAIAMELRPARGMDIRLAGYGRRPWEAVAVGRIVGDEGRFTLSVPEDQLELEPAAYELQAQGPSAGVLLAAPVALSRQVERATRDLDPATTVVALAARRAGAGKHVAKWDVDTLARLPEVQAATARLARLSASEERPAAPGGLAVLEQESDSPELQAAITAILQSLAAP